MIRGWTQKTLRWPILAFVFLVLGLEFLLYLLVRLCVLLFELSSSWRFRAAKRRLKEAEDFPAWCQAARELDRLEGRDAWKQTDDSPYYDFQLVREHLAGLHRARSNRDFSGLLQLLKLIFQTYNVGGINNQHLYNQTHFGSKMLVHDFLSAVIECTVMVRDAEEIPLAQRRDFFRKARKWYGRSALLLSGGAGMGYMHTGVLKTLIEARCLPQVLSGASAGSLMCAFVSVRTDQEVLRELCVPESERFFRACCEPFCVKLTRWMKHGYAFDKDQWREQMRANITKGDTTFLEAYQLTGRIINIAVTGVSKYSPSVILNYRSTPDVVIWSAVLASSAFPNFLAPIELQVKDPVTKELKPFHMHGKAFFDGTIKNDIPIKQLSKMWGCNFFIVSQVNPHLVPLFFAQRGGTGRPAASFASQPGKGTSSGLRGGFILSMFEKFLKLEMGKWLKFLSDLDLQPTMFGADWRFIWLQSLTGTTTIVPDAPLWVYLRLLSDPNYERMKAYLALGEKATWSKLCRISNHYRIERLLVECSRSLELQARKAGLPPVRAERVYHMNAPATLVKSSRGEGEEVAAMALPSSPDSSPEGSSSSALSRRRSDASASHKKKQRAKAVGAHPNFTNQNSTTEEQMRHSHKKKKGKRTQNGADPSVLSSSPSPPHPPLNSTANDPIYVEEVDPFLLEEDVSLPTQVIEGRGEVEPSSTTAMLLENEPLPMWKRGAETDTDITDEEEEAQLRRRYELGHDSQ